MTKQEVLKLASVAASLVKQLRGPDCDPDSVRRLAAGEELPTDHHARNCLDCQGDAERLRAEMENPRPAAPLTFLWISQRARFQSADGLVVPLSDHSTARVRIHPDDADPTLVKLTVDQTQVTGRATVEIMSLECRRAHEPLASRTSRPLSGGEHGVYCITMPRAELDDPANRFLIRVMKRSVEVQQTEPVVMKLRVETPPLKLVADKTSREDSGIHDTRSRPDGSITFVEPIATHKERNFMRSSRTDARPRQIEGRSPIDSFVKAAIILAMVIIPLSGGGFVARWLTVRRHDECAENLNWIGFAMYKFETANKHFPSRGTCDADGKPLLSWRVRLLPFLGEEPLYREFHLNEPWDSPHNRGLIERMPDVFRCPSQNSSPLGKTTYLRPIWMRDRKIVDYQAQLRIADFTDGLSETVMIVEVDDDHGVSWTKPDDFEWESLPLQDRLALRHGSGINVLFYSGEVVWLQGVSDEDLVTFFTRNSSDMPRVANEIHKRERRYHGPSWADAATEAKRWSGKKGWIPQERSTLSRKESDE